MNSFERVMNTLQGLPVDRPPVLAVLGAYGGRLTGVPLPELYTNADKYVSAQQAVIDTFGIDMALAPFDFSAIAEAFGSEIKFFDHQPPNMKRPAASNIAEALTLPLPGPQTAGRLPMILDATRKLAALYKGTVPVFAVVPGPAALPVLLMGMELWLETALFNESAAKHILQRTATFWTQWANALLDAGADALVVTEGMASATISTRELFEEKFLPHVRGCFAKLNGPAVFHSTSGPINHVIDLLPDLPNLAGIAISSKDDLSKARKKVGSTVPILGNIDTLVFPSSTTDEIRALATDWLNTADVGPVVLCNAGGDIPIDTPPENIHALREAAGQFAAENNRSTLWIVCSVLSAEVGELHRQGKIEGELLLLNSMLHMDPPKLEKTLRSIIDRHDRPKIMVYGDCCPAMLQLADGPNVVRVDGANCIQMLVGKKRFKELMHAESFVLLPEWMPRWKEIIERELGLNGDVARDLFRENRKELVYLDTGVAPVPTEHINACSAYLGLPVRIEKTGLTHLLQTLQTAQNGLQRSQ